MFVNVIQASAVSDVKEDNALVFQQEPIGSSCQSSSPDAAQRLAEGLYTNCCAPSDIATDIYRNLFPSVCRNADQFAAWQMSRPWLVFNPSTGSVQCSHCAEIKQLGIHAERGQRNKPAFVDGTVEKSKDAKTLLKKIDKHRDSAFHAKCEALLK